MKIRLRPLAAAILAGAASVSHAAFWVNTATLLPEDLPAGSGGTRFGNTVAIDRYADGSVRALYVGAPNASANYLGVDHPGAGKVYVLTPAGGWHVATTITAAGTPYAPQDNAHFGAALAVHEGVVAVGAPDFDYGGTHADSGAVLVYEDTTRNDPARPAPVLQGYPPGHRVSQKDGSHMGASVALGGASLAAGAWMAWGAPDEDSLGCVRVVHLLRPGDEYGGAACGSAGSELGASLAIFSDSASGYVVVAGAPGVMQGDQSLAGAAYVYVPVSGNITLLDTLTAPSPAFLDAFGTAVALDATHIYVGGAGRVKSGTGRTGSVSMFVPSGFLGYGFDTEIFPGTGANAGDLCGASLSTEYEMDGRVAMGCPGHDGLVANEGAVRVLTLGSFMGTPFWFQDRLDMNDLPHGADDLGRDVALAGDHVYAGAPLHDDAIGMNNGAVREFATDLIFRDGFQ